MRLKDRRRVLGVIALGSVLVAGYVAAGYAAPKSAASGAAPLTDTEPPVETQPAPDPAPPAPKAAPKPAPKPAAKSAPAPKPAPRPAKVYHTPVTQTQSPAPTHVSTPTHVAPAKKRVVHHKKHERRAHHASPAPEPKAQVKHANVVRVAVVPAVETNESGTVRRSMVISGMAAAALLFLLVVAVPATMMRFTTPGRLVMDHQTDLVLAGIALLLLTGLLFALTGNGS